MQISRYPIVTTKCASAGYCFYLTSKIKAYLKFLKIKKELPLSFSANFKIDNVQKKAFVCNPCLGSKVLRIIRSNLIYHVLWIIYQFVKIYCTMDWKYLNTLSSIHNICYIRIHTLSLFFSQKEFDFYSFMKNYNGFHCFLMVTVFKWSHTIICLAGKMPKVFCFLSAVTNITHCTEEGTQCICVHICFQIKTCFVIQLKDLREFEYNQIRQDKYKSEYVGNNPC